MKASPILNRYLARHYIMNLLLMLGCLLALIYMFDAVELLRRASKRDNIPLSTVMQMSLFKLWDVAPMTFPFAVLFSGMLTFWQLTRRYELTVVRASGFSVWQFLTPIMGVALLTGVIMVTILNPVGAVLLTRYETLERNAFSQHNTYAALFDEGLWLRQSRPDGYIILHADKVKMPDWQLQSVMALYFAGDDTLQKRIDAPAATLNAEKGEWVFSDATVNQGQDKPVTVPLVSLPTELTPQEIVDSVASPETLSFWRLPSFIKIMESTGFDAARLKIHFHSLLAQPLLFIAMILLAAAVSLRPPRSRGTFTLIITGVITGFVAFFLSSFLQALGASHQIPVLLAAWSPAFLMLVLGMAAILNLEDG
jgi:lipopolysaccharide export system permease protein